jgi:hypothetical protein
LVVGINYEFTESLKKLTQVYPHQMPSYPKKYKVACQKKNILAFKTNTKV